MSSSGASATVLAPSPSLRGGAAARPTAMATSVSVVTPTLALDEAETASWWWWGSGESVGGGSYFSPTAARGVPRAASASAARAVTSQPACAAALAEEGLHAGEVRDQSAGLRARPGWGSRRRGDDDAARGGEERRAPRCCELRARRLRSHADRTPARFGAVRCYRR